MTEPITESTAFKTDIKTLIAVISFAVMATIAYYSLKEDNARLAERLTEAIMAQHSTEARLAAVEKWQIETLVTLRMKGIISGTPD